MTPQELSDNMKKARDEQFGPEQPAEEFPDMYFRKDVYTTAPNGQTTQRAPKNCATYLGASQLSQLFTDNPVGSLRLDGIVYGNAVVFTGLTFGWHDNIDVPYLQFISGPIKKQINCGLILDYFNHGFPPAIAMEGAVNEVQGAFAN